METTKLSHKDKRKAKKNALQEERQQQQQLKEEPKQSRQKDVKNRKIKETVYFI